MYTYLFVSEAHAASIFRVEACRLVNLCIKKLTNPHAELLKMEAECTYETLASSLTTTLTTQEQN
jgi:hypothetical protein